MAVLRVLFAPLRWILQECLELLFGLAVFVSVIYLTGKADGNWLLAVLILTPVTGFLIWFALRRRARTD